MDQEYTEEQFRKVSFSKKFCEILEIRLQKNSGLCAACRAKIN